MSEFDQQREILQAVQALQGAEKARYAQLDDYTVLARDILNLKTVPHEPNIPWFTFEEGSPYRYMAEHLEQKNGKDKAVFAPRGIGKSVLALMLQMKYIMKDRSFTLRIGSEAKTEVVKRSIWIRDQLTHLEDGYGPFRGPGIWEKDRFTVVRPAAGVLDETVTLTSPDSPGTGAHPRAFLLDDAVGDIAEQSQAKMSAGVDWYKRLGSQELGGGSTWVVGTFRLGWNIYKYILQVIEGGLRKKQIAPGIWRHEGKQFDILVCTVRDDDGNPVFPCHDNEYLDRKLRRVGKAQFKTQFNLQLPGEEDTTFNSDSVCWGKPPEGTPLRTYILTDTATSTGKTRHTSMSALGAVSKTPDDKGYVREMRMGKLSPDRVPEIILALWKKWRAEKIAYENTGPARAYMSAVRKLAEAQGVPKYVIHTMFKEIGRPSDKHFRIQAYLAPHCDTRDLYFNPEIKGPGGLLRIGEDNRLEGVLGRSFEDYYYGADGSWDGLDMLGDIWGEDSAGVQIFKPPPKKPGHMVPSNWQERKVQLMRQLRGPQGIF